VHEYPKDRHRGHWAHIRSAGESGDFAAVALIGGNLGRAIDGSSTGWSTPSFDAAGPRCRDLMAEAAQAADRTAKNRLAAAGYVPPSRSRD